MYLNFYQLRKAPFNITPDLEFLFLSPSHRHALEAIGHGILERKGFVVVTGEVGLGKTTLVHSALERVDPQRVKVISTFHANVSFAGLLETLAREFHIGFPTEDPEAAINRLHEVLTAEDAQNRAVVLIIDEAQNLPVATLRSLRLLSNLETATRKLLQIILVGQPELARKLDLPELQPLKQCIALRATLSPLTPQDSLAYIQHRLAKVALAQAPIFTVGALKRIVAHAQGVPRLLNILCDNALIAGFASQQRPVSAKLVQEVIADLEGAPATVSSPAATSPWKPTLALACVLLGVLGVFSYRNFSVPTWLRQDLPQAHTPVSTGHDGQDKEPVLTAAPAPQAIGQETEKPRAADSQVPAPPPQAKIEVQPAAPPVKTPEPPAKTPEPPAKAPEPPVPLETTFPVTRVVKPGDSLSKLIASVYGASSNDLVEWVKAHNPRIQDTNVIVVGERIVFPEFNEAAKKELRERRRRAEKDNEEPF